MLLINITNIIYFKQKNFVKIYATFSKLNVEQFVHVVVILLKNIFDLTVDLEEAILASVDNVHRRTRASRVHIALVYMNTIITSVLHNFRVAHARTIVDDELGFWVLPHSTTWFLQFLLQEYDNDKWVANFRFNRRHFPLVHSVGSSL